MKLLFMEQSFLILESVMDKVVKVNRSESEEDDQTKNGTLEDNNNSVQKGNGGKKNKQILIEGDENDEDVEVEEVELEFENVIPKLHNHNAYCPNCDAKITKVILRRKIPKKIITPSVTITTQQNEERELVGCLSCFSIFMPKGKMLHPFPIFGGGADDTADIAEASSQQFQSIPKSAPKGVWNSIMADNAANAKRHGYERLPLPTVNSGDMSINIRDLPGTSGLSTNLLPITEIQSNSLEIVKSIVYGGLIGSRTSLSLVSSAAASGAATLNIVALVLANLIGGLFVLAQTLSKLKNGQQEENYREALGRKQRFLLHATIVMISYMVFGLVPPMVYGFTFHGTDDKDYKLLAVAVASLICIIFLAIGKAYIVQKAQQLHKFSTYFKHVVYYVATTAIVSGIGYVVGDQAKKILEHYGWMLPKDQASNTLFLHGS
ncbi:hypothetical protein Leryth_017831 [Lithospermum erythrorhizon]|nr:hypothetical protein Leryth_017831 [Lithospermum erythrorhizon]